MGRSSINIRSTPTIFLGRGGGGHIFLGHIFYSHIPPQHPPAPSPPRQPPASSRSSASFLQALGLRSGAAPEQVKQAYRQLALKWHPDKNAARPGFRASGLRESVESGCLLSSRSGSRGSGTWGLGLSLFGRKNWGEGFWKWTWSLFRD